MNNYSLRDFYKSHDSGKIDNMPIFLYQKETSTLVNHLYISYYKNAEWHLSEVNSSQVSPCKNVSFFIKDYHSNASHVIFSAPATGEQCATYISKLVNQNDEIVLSEPVQLDFMQGHSIVLGSASLVNDIIFISFIDKTSQSSYSVALDANDLSQLSPIENIKETLSFRYFDEVNAQLIGSLSQCSDGQQGCFLQLSNSSENISVFKVHINEENKLSCIKLFAITEENIGAFSGTFDKEKSLLITCYAQFKEQFLDWNINGVVNKIFSESDTVYGGTYAALPLNSTPGIYYRPQVMIHADNYAVSWEGGDNLHLREFNEQIHAISPERYSRAKNPGRHRTVALEDKYFLGYQNDCPEPRSHGLDYKKIEM